MTPEETKPTWLREMLTAAFNAGMEEAAKIAETVNCHDMDPASVIATAIRASLRR